MSLRLQTLCFFILSLLHVIFAVDSIANQIALGSASGFSSLSTCGLCCFCTGTATSNCTSAQCVSEAVQCDSNSCLCRKDKLQDALAYTETCVRNACSDEGEPSAYQNVLSGYCLQWAATASSLSTAVTFSTVTTSGIYIQSLIKSCTNIQ
jgi:hypothetical protein